MKRVIALGAAAAALVLALSGCGARAARQHDAGTRGIRTTQTTAAPAKTTTPATAATSADVSGDLNAVDKALSGIDTSLSSIDQNLPAADKAGDDDN